MENLKLPIALVAAMAAQFGAGVWWVSQQAAIISDLKENVSQMSSRMAIEENVNLRRDVARNAEDIEGINEDLTGFNMMLTRQLEILGRIGTLEAQMRIFERDHTRALDQ